MYRHLAWRCARCAMLQSHRDMLRVTTAGHGEPEGEIEVQRRVKAGLASRQAGCMVSPGLWCHDCPSPSCCASRTNASICAWMSAGSVGQAVMTDVRPGSMCTLRARSACTAVCCSCISGALWGVAWELREGCNALICRVCARMYVADASGGGPQGGGSIPADRKSKRLN